MPDSGGLSKMTITAYLPPTGANQPLQLSADPADKHTVLVNPDKYTQGHTILRDTRQPTGSAGTQTRLVGVAPSTYNFDFLFDATGVIPKAAEGPLAGVPILGALADLLGGGSEEYDVMAEIEKFNHVVYRYRGDTHGPRPVQIVWGTFIVKFCYLTSLNYDFKLFRPDGTPLRAVGHGSFIEGVPTAEQEHEIQAASPDLTHVRIVKAGDTLPLLTESIYNDASLYLEVARVNGLVNFRRLEPGTRLIFPPLDRTKK